MSRLARVAALCLVVCAPAMAAGQGRHLSGTITYRERIALSPTAVVDIRLDDVTRPASAPPMIARTRIEHPGQVPIAFDLPYDTQLTDPGGRYAVRATISDGGVMLFASMDTVLVITQGHGARADLVLTRIAGATPPSAARSRHRRPRRCPPSRW